MIKTLNTITTDKEMISTVPVNAPSKNIIRNAEKEHIAAKTDNFVLETRTKRTVPAIIVDIVFIDTF
jgi:hypothetical protein